MADDAGTAEPSDALRDAVRASQKPVALIDLESVEFAAASKAGAAALGADAIEGRSPLDFSDDVPATRAALQQLRDGVFDAYTANRRVRQADGTAVDLPIWVSVLGDEPPRSLALLVVIEKSTARDASGTPSVLGAVDSDHRITQLSAEVRDMLGFTPDECVGQKLTDLVHPDDVESLRRVLRMAADGKMSAGKRVRVCRSQGGYADVDVAASAADGSKASDRLGFAAVGSERSGNSGGGERVAELERHLTRIAREVEAAGLIAPTARIMDPERLPGLNDLSARQWEIVARLLRGERVPTIAREMYLSASTVRNHLSTVYRKLGVHSQAELIDLLQPHDG
jgi:PAS domain S-box-containing protein